MGEARAGERRPLGGVRDESGSAPVTEGPEMGIVPMRMGAVELIGVGGSAAGREVPETISVVLDGWCSGSDGAESC